MRISRTDTSGSSEMIDEAARMIKDGGLIIYPTDTVYGIGCDAFSSTSVERLSKIKARGDKPFSVAFSSIKMLKKYAKVGITELGFIREHYDEPYTFILKNKNIPVGVTAGLSTVGVRIPACDITRSIIEAAGTPIISTSSNAQGEPAPRTVDEISKSMLESADLVINTGPCKWGKPSRILDLSTGKTLREF